MKFNKRIYKNPKDIFTDLFFPIRNRSQLRELNRARLISAPFRERLMLAVTAVNDCRYCSYYHTKQALKSGITKEEIRDILAGDIVNCPKDEAVAVAYAQHWAESNARPDQGVVKRLQQTYGREKTEAINLILRMIRMANLLGNSWDYLLYRISFGKKGL